MLRTVKAKLETAVHEAVDIGEAKQPEWGPANRGLLLCAFFGVFPVFFLCLSGVFWSCALCTCVCGAVGRCLRRRGDAAAAERVSKTQRLRATVEGPEGGMRHSPHPSVRRKPATAAPLRLSEALRRDAPENKPPSVSLLVGSLFTPVFLLLLLFLVFLLLSDGVDKLVEACTAEFQTGPDWAKNMQIVDKVRSFRTEQCVGRVVSFPPSCPCFTSFFVSRHPPPSQTP